MPQGRGRGRIATLGRSSIRGADGPKVGLALARGRRSRGRLGPEGADQNGRSCCCRRRRPLARFPTPPDWVTALTSERYQQQGQGAAITVGFCHKNMGRGSKPPGHRCCDEGGGPRLSIADRPGRSPLPLQPQDLEELFSEHRTATGGAENAA